MAELRASLARPQPRPSGPGQEELLTTEGSLTWALLCPPPRAWPSGPQLDFVESEGPPTPRNSQESLLKQAGPSWAGAMPR